MTKRLFVFTLLFSIGFSGFAQQKSDQKHVEDLIQNSFDDLFSSFQIEKVSDYYTDDFILLEQGEVWDLDMINNYFKQGATQTNPNQRVNRFEFIETRVDENRAWTSYWNYATFSKGGEVIRDIKWLESATAVRTKDGWRLDMLHSTRVEVE